jgi:hypothetical protein
MGQMCFLAVVFGRTNLDTKILDNPVHMEALTYSMQQSPSWEANQFAANEKTPPISWNPKVHHRIHKRLPLVPILNHLNPA